VRLTSSEKIKCRLDGDISLIKSHARFIIYVDDEGFPLRMLEREEGYKLDVLAIIGSAEVEDMYFPEVILLEIGMGKTKPYHDAKVPKNLHKEGETTWIHKRQKMASLSQKQLSNLWPYLENILVGKAIKQMSGWKSHTRVLPNSLVRISHGNRGIHIKDTFREVKSGVRFSVSFADMEMIKVVLSSHLIYMKETMRKLSYSLNRFLQRYKNSSYSSKELNLFTKSEHGGVKAIVQYCDNIPALHIAKMFQENMIGNRSLLEQVFEQFGLCDMEDVFFFMEILEKINPRIIFEEATIWIPTEGFKKGRDSLVFQVQPNVFFEGNKEDQ